MKKCDDARRREITLLNTVDFLFITRNFKLAWLQKLFTTLDRALSSSTIGYDGREKGVVGCSMVMSNKYFFLLEFYGRSQTYVMQT